jgi:hypothetical protein
MRIRLAVPDELDDKDRKAALDAALESVTRTNTGLIRQGIVPPAAKMIKAGRVKWRPEPPGDEHFDLPTTVIQRGHGDCDDLAPWHASSLRASGVDPGARAIVKRSGPKRWHAVVERSDGSIEDPSAHAGMYDYQRTHGVSGAGDEVLGAYAAIQPPMASDGRLCLAICPGRDPRHPHVWFARCDVPDRLEPWDWSSMSASHHPAKALIHAVKGCSRVAGPDMDLDDRARLIAVHDLLMGVDPEDVANQLDRIMGSDVDSDQVVGEAAQSVGFFGDLLKAVASPITSAVKFVQHPSLSNLTHMATDPFNAALKAVPGHQLLQPIAKMAQPFAGFIPGFGPLASAGLDALAHGGLPSDPAGLAAFAMRNAANIIPGGGMLSNVMRMVPGGGGGGIPGLPGLLGPLMAAMQGGAGSQPAAAFNAPRLLYEAGKVARPWGAGGPAVMRF